MRRTRSRFLYAVSYPLILLLLFPGVFSLNVVMLGSITIFTTHDWLPLQPTIHFNCQGENMTLLPNVKETNVMYTFKGEESWQPLTELSNKKCKRCGFYERDSIGSDNIFDEWELCASDFVGGKYMHFKAKEFNATFLCPLCSSSESSVNQTSIPEEESPARRRNVVLMIVVSILVSTVAIVGLVAAYKYWQKRKMEQNQARFLKLFQEIDDVEAELDLENTVLS